MPFSLFPQPVLYFLALFLFLSLSLGTGHGSRYLAHAPPCIVFRGFVGRTKVSKVCRFRHDDEGRKTNELSRDGSRLILSLFPLAVELASTDTSDQVVLNDNGQTEGVILPMGNLSFFFYGIRAVSFPIVHYNYLMILNFFLNYRCYISKNKFSRETIFPRPRIVVVSNHCHS